MTEPDPIRTATTLIHALTLIVNTAEPSVAKTAARRDLGLLDTHVDRPDVDADEALRMVREYAARLVPVMTTDPGDAREFTVALPQTRQVLRFGLTLSDVPAGDHDD